MDKVIPKKSLGQHWLHDNKTLKQICTDAKLVPEDVVLEIGPGLGTLTEVMLRMGATVIAVEFDSMLANLLKERMDRQGVPTDKLTVVQSDILEFNFSELPHGYKVVANIPYYLTSNLIRRLCESPVPFSTAAILIQKEVAERVCAQPGQMSLLSVTTQYYSEASLGVFVPAALFTPPPKVDSQVLVLTMHEQPLFDGVDIKKYFSIVKAGFSQKRKTLENSLSAGLRLPKVEVRHMLEAASIAPNTRAQKLSLEDWHKLYLAYNPAQKASDAIAL
jgi:16S rRNA (adenine1518-N6/adenine1519-N6)-dimethyltransferase